MKSGKWIITMVSIFFIAVFVIGFFLIQHRVRTDPNVARKINSPLPVVTARAEVTNLSSIIGASGYTQPIAVIDLTSSVPGVVKNVHIDIGDSVQEGQPLIQLEDAVFSAAYRSAEQKFKKAKADFTMQKEIVQLLVEEARSQYDTMEKLVKKRRSDFEYADLMYRNALTEYEKKLISRIEFEEASARLKNADYLLSDSLEKFHHAKNRLDHISLEVDIEKEKSLQAFMEAKYEMVRTRDELNGTSFVSPVNGIILERNADPGEMIKKNYAVMTVGRMDTVSMNVNVPEEQFHEIRKGQAADVVLDSFPDEILKGTVIRIGPVADETLKAVPVAIALDNKDLKLQAGMSGYARIKNDHSGLAVPSVAVINPTAAKKAVVFVVDESSNVHLRTITTGVVSEGWTEVVEGLREREEVVTMGQFHLNDGDKVFVRKENGQKTASAASGNNLYVQKSSVSKKHMDVERSLNHEEQKVF